MVDVTSGFRGNGLAPESSVSAVSWPAILAGAVVACAMSLALLALGGGIGLGSVSPWSNSGLSGTGFGILAAAWLIAVQLFSAGVGGYMAGRLRTQWVGVHTDEVFFRDTAHGFLAWAVSTIVAVGILASVVSSVASGAASAASGVASGAGSALSAAAGAAGSNADPTAYFTDMLFRSDRPAQAGAAPGNSAEAGRILARSLGSGDLDASDRTYVAQMVATRTGLSQADAEKRVDAVVSQAKTAAATAADTARKAADAARKAGVYLALWTFVSLLVGAFSASFLATVGGRLRDDLPAV